MRRKESSASRYGSGSSSLHYDLLEKDNDNHLSHLRTQARQHKTAVARVKSLLQVASLKSLSLDIEAEVKSQNEFLGEMDSSFGGAGELLRSTMAKLGVMLKSGGSRHMWYLAAFIVFIFLLIWFLTKS